MDNILSSRLYRPGSVAYVSRSGGMSNELNNIIAQNTDGVYEGVAIGGDRSFYLAFVLFLPGFEPCSILYLFCSGFSNSSQISEYEFHRSYSSLSR